MAKNRQRWWKRVFKPAVTFGRVTNAIAQEHVRYPSQIMQLAIADLVKTYRGSALGWAWAIVKPSIRIAVFWFAFAIALRIGHPVNGMPFFLWLIAGFLPWFYMGDMITGGAKALNRYSYLVSRIQFPVSTIPTFVSISKLLVHFLLILLVTAIFLVWGYTPDIYFVQLPFYTLMMFGFFTTWSLFSAPLAAVNKDFFNLIRSLFTPVFWLSGILWDVSRIEIDWLRHALLFNPVTFVATGYRNVFVTKQWFYEDAYALAAFASVSLVMFVLAIFTYGRLRKEIADVL